MVSKIKHGGSETAKPVADLGKVLNLRSDMGHHFEKRSRGCHLSRVDKIS